MKTSFRSSTSALGAHDNFSEPKKTKKLVTIQKSMKNQQTSEHFEDFENSFVQAKPFKNCKKTTGIPSDVTIN